MYARINYVDIRPDSFAEIDPFWRETVETYEGLIRAYFLREGDSAHTLSVVLFNDEQSMRVNTEQSLIETVKKAADYRLNEPELHHLEVCAHIDQRAGEIACARVVDVTLKVEHMEKAIGEWVEVANKYGDDLKGGYLCGDRTDGKVKSVTLWTSRAAVEARVQDGTFQAVVGAHEHLMAVPPVSSYWDLRVSVG